MDPISDTKKLIPSKTYPGRELISMLEGMVELAHFEADDQVIKMNKVRGITEMIFNLNELDNTYNLEDGRPSNSLLLMKIFCISNPTPHSTRNLKLESLFP